MNIDKYLNVLNIGIYKLESNTTQNNFILHLKDTNKFYTEISMIMMFDILMNKYLRVILELGLEDNELYKYDHLKNLKDIDIREFIITHQKIIFTNFKNFVLLSKINVDGFDIKPVNKRIIEKQGSKYLNIYVPLINFENIAPITERKFPHIETLLKNILQEGYEHFLKLLAWKIQFPDKVIPNHWIIQDDGGTGKTEFLANDILSNIFNVAIISQGELEETYTSYMKNTLFVIAEEIEGYSNEKKIKHLTGAKKIKIRELYKNAYDVINYNNFIILSNDIKPLKISLNDRRFNVVGGGLRLAPDSSGDWSKTLFGSKEKNKQFFKGYHENIEQERLNLIAYLKQLKLDRVEVQQTLNTKLKQELEEINYNSENAFYDYLLKVGFNTIIKEIGKNNLQLNDFFKNLIKKDGYYWIRSSFIYSLYVNYCKESNLKPMGNIGFFKRLRKMSHIDKIFTDFKLISSNNEKFMAIKLNNKAEINKFIENEM